MKQITIRPRVRADGYRFRGDKEILVDGVVWATATRKSHGPNGFTYTICSPTGASLLHAYGYKSSVEKSAIMKRQLVKVSQIRIRPGDATADDQLPGVTRDLIRRRILRDPAIIRAELDEKKRKAAEREAAEEARHKKMHEGLESLRGRNDLSEVERFCVESLIERYKTESI